MPRKNINRRIVQFVMNWFFRPGACHAAMIAAGLNIRKKMGSVGNEKYEIHRYEARDG
tara:strand:- start:212 stop:385 length:174 start_codon:yes stop_codon:yes gene_type:complete